MLYVAELACELADSTPGRIKQIDPPAMQTVVKRLSTDKIRTLGWEPEVDLYEGMVRTMSWVVTLDKHGAVAA